ncbi:MFS transporter [Yinghuangia seranimata]|uniref:MFS transporter n=1 Tax=Yinghuangia seranimata TaxID=408067 RepID=UPI00248CB4AF|nr:MFS transporter [Yinghuangia seranimata]MDI2125425.1 MFS transporter [Yinghuangia seranimata]
MSAAPYRQVLAVPGAGTLLLLTLAVRIPVTAGGVTVLLHVVDSLHRGYFDAGLVGTAAAVGTAVGAPQAGRFIDRLGLRPVVAATTAVGFLTWTAAPFLPYPLLLLGALVSGLFSPPVFAVRQCLAAVMPSDLRHTAFTLDTMGVELSFMIGPTLAVAAATALGTTATMIGIGAALGASGIALIRLNPTTRTAQSGDAAAHVPRRQWLTARLVALYIATCGTSFVANGVGLGQIAVLKEQDAQLWIGLVGTAWCLYSVTGGFIYGSLPKDRVSPLLLIGLFSALTIPLALLPTPWPWLILALLPTGLLCTPAFASIVDAVSALAPQASRGEAMGLQMSAFTLGGAASGPVLGSTIDHHGPGWAFAATGAIGLALVLPLALHTYRNVNGPATSQPSFQESRP